MNFKSVCIWFAKAFSAGCAAFLIMTVFCLFYYNVPVHYPNNSGTTDYKWNPDAFYSRCTEGIAAGRTNNEGFINPFDYEEGMEIHTLVMGSSHMEAYQVAQNENTAARLNGLLQDRIVYNIGISGHNFLTCCSNFKAAVEYYHPEEYVVVETARLDFSPEELDSVLNGEVPEIADHSKGVLAFLSKNQFIRLLYSQLKGFLGQASEDEQEAVGSFSAEVEDSRGQLDNVLSMLSGIAAENQVKIIIVYHPAGGIHADGTLKLPDDADARETFSVLCDKNGIAFLDMTERFQREYESRHILPHGFCNSSVGSGHLNRYGHEMIADELYQMMEK